MKINSLSASDIWNLWSNIPTHEKLEVLKNETFTSADAIIWGYKLFLDRNPEEANVVIPSLNILINSFSEKLAYSTEFTNRLFRIKTAKEVFAIYKDIKDFESAPNQSDQLIIWQSCDSEKYLPMLEITQKTVLEYCKKHKVKYDSYIGIKKGYHPIHAAYNRIYKLNELLDEGYDGWFLYMDTDAYICDINYNLLDYIKDKYNYSMIVTPVSDTAPYWDTNNGIFFINFKHPMSPLIIRKWKHYYDVNYSEDDYKKANKWNMILNDQTTLNTILRIDLLEKYIYTKNTRQLFNSSSASVIKQVLRSNAKENCFETLSDRIQRIRQHVDQIVK